MAKTPSCYPPCSEGEATRLSDAKVEAKETRPPPRYNEGTLIDAMQNAWRFVMDEILRDRLKEAKGIGTPATRGEIIRGLKAQEFLVADGKHIVPTERGLVLHGVLESADPALVDPGVTAQMECLLDDVLVGRQDMMAAINAICDQASRIIGRLTEQGPSDTIPTILATAAAPTSRSRKKPIRATNTVPATTAGAGTKQRRSTRSKLSSAKTSGSRSKRLAANNGGDVSSGETPLRIPFGNKEAAQTLGARYRAGGWYAPPDVSLAGFRERGWL